MKRKKPEPVADTPTYQVTDNERVALNKQIERFKREPVAPRLKVVRREQGTAISSDHPNEDVGRALLMEALGTADVDFGEGLVRQVIGAASHGGKIVERELNFMLSVIKGIKPSDHLEAMLGAQMAIVYTTLMKFGQKFFSVEDLAQQEIVDRAFNKLARTFVMQMEALKRYRTGGEQKVTVQHVSVNEGGQAIVGNVTQATPQTSPEKPADKTPALTDARQAAMPIMGKRKRAAVSVRRKNDNGGRSST